MNLGQHIAGRDLSLNDVARKTSLSIDRLTQIMEGDDASLAEMRRIARAIRVPMSILLDDEAREADAPFNVLLRQGLEQRNDDLESSMDIIAQQIRDVLTIAKNLPSNSSWLDLFRGLTPSIDYAENFSAIFRRAFAALDDQEPYLFLGQTLDELGVLLCYARDARVDGVSAVVEGRPLVLLAARTFKPRMLFTLAHEVGHLVARHDLREQNFARADRNVLASEEEWGRRRDDERFADAFASSLLMPRKGFLKLLHAIREHVGATGALGDVEILIAARFFGVGFEAAARRCEQLNLLEPRGARALYQKICDDFGNPERRAEALGLGAREDILISTSRRLIEEAVRLVREEKLSAGRAAELLNVPLSMLFAANSG